MKWLRVLWNVITSDAVMEPLIIILVGYGLQVYQRNRRYQIILDTTVDIVDYIEEHYKEWGIKGHEKMDKFMELFVKEFKKATGKAPRKDEIETAVLRAEAYVQRARRGVATHSRGRRAA
ncbi:MAG: hypothetical protein ACM3X3_02585 [Betaproteobacteria bacterium]